MSWQRTSWLWTIGHWCHKTLFQNYFSKLSSWDIFDRWCHRFICCLLSLSMNYLRLLPSNFSFFFNVVSINFFHISCSHKFHTWCHQSVCCLFSLWRHLYVFWLENLQTSFTLSLSTLYCISVKNSSRTLVRWRHHYVCCLFILWRNFLCVFPPNLSSFSNVVSIKFWGL